MRTGGFRQDCHAVAVGEVSKPAVMIVGDSIRYRLAEVGEEGIAGADVIHDKTGSDRQVGQQVIPHVVSEIFLETLAPVHSAALPAVSFHVLERAPHMMRRVIQNRLYNLGNVEVEGFRVHIVQHEAIPSF